MHLYSIPDDQPDQDSNRGLPYLGRIFLEDHMACAHLFELAQRRGCDLHPFEDVRLTSAQVRELSSIFRTAAAQDRDEYGARQRILDLLAGAEKSGAGLLSFCD